MDLKRTINEITTIYSFEPDIKDIYVEGTIDKHFIDWYLHRKGLNDITVYPIDLIDIPIEILNAHELPTNSYRSQVIAFSIELSKRTFSHCQVMCIIDRDSDELIPPSIANSYLFTTDGNSLELYAFTPDVLDKFLLVTLAGFPLSTDNLLTQMTTVLERLFAIRQANKILKMGMTWIPFAKYVNVSKTTILFREEDFIRSYLQANNQWHQHSYFINSVNTIAKNMSPESNKRIRGHDIGELLCLVIRKLRKRRVLGNPEIVEGCLLSAIECSDLSKYSLFQYIDNIAK